MEMNESFDRALEPQPSKRKRSSILRPAEKRQSRDSRTVSFNERCIFKELHQDGTCDITNLFLREDMDLTMMDIVEPAISIHNQTVNSSMEMSLDQNSLVSNHNNTLGSDDGKHNRTLIGSDDANQTLDEESKSQIIFDEENNRTLTEENMIDKSDRQPQRTQPPHQQPPSQTSQRNHSQTHHNNSSQMDITLINQFMNTMPKFNSIELPSVNYDAATIYEKKMSIGSDMSGISSLNSTLIANSCDTSDNNQSDIVNESTFRDETTFVANKDNNTLINNFSRMSEISSFNERTLADQSANDTLFGAFHDSNNMSMQSRTSGMDTLLHNIDALNDCIQRVDHETEEIRRKLDEEIEELFKFYRHIVNKDNKYEFAIKIFGLRHSLWLIIKVNPETYPNEKLGLKFAVNKRDRHLYPFPEYAEAVRRCTKEGRQGYLTKFVINAQKFRRFLRTIGYRRPIK